MSPMLRPLLPALFATLGCSTLVLGLVGCKPPAYPACKKDKHCRFELDERCVDGMCQDCTKDEDCAGRGARFVCRKFRCVPPSLADK